MLSFLAASSRSWVIGLSLKEQGKRLSQCLSEGSSRRLGCVPPFLIGFTWNWAKGLFFCHLLFC